ncbi:MAG: urea ABC transporter ATP-binding protein UrtD [Pseudomonadota bacterium]
MSTALLSVEAITVQYGVFRAIDGFSLTLTQGETRVVIGPNGAGKSTLCDTIIGRVRPAEGRIMLGDEDITKTPEHEIVSRGICRKFQNPGVLKQLTVAENLALAAQPDKRWWRSFTWTSAQEEQEQAAHVLAQVGLMDRRDEPAGLLSHGEQQWLEIGMVLATGASLILLDEPTAGMGPRETSKTAELIHALGDSRTVLVIDHDMAFVEQLGTTVTVMHQGKFLAEGSVADIRANEDVAAVYLGQSA